MNLYCLSKEQYKVQVISFHNLGIDMDSSFLLGIILKLVAAVEPINWVFIDFNPDTLLC